MTHPCPQCGEALAEGMAEGLCPACLLKQGLASGTVPQPGKDAFAPPSPADLNRHFPQLEILELIGQGGMGAVYKARQKDLDRFVALKILPPDAGRDPGFAERFSREARVLAQLNHPNIVAIHDFGKTGGLYWVMMEYVDGMNLRQLLRARKIAPKEALAIVPQICDALQFAHDEGIVHRDIKPENILLDKKGRVKIADFGLAKILRPQSADFTLTDAGATMGTPHYMAPEQVEKPQDVDHRADIFSLGVVFYEMLTGELPLGKFAPPSHKIQMDVRLDEVVLRSLEKEPDRRYQHASEVKTIVGTIVTTPYQKSADVPPGSPADIQLENARRQVSGPAIGLIVAGVLNMALFALFFIRMMPFSSHAAHMRWADMFPLIPLLAMFVGAFIIYAAVKMMQLERRGMALAAGILVMIVPPACLLGLPIGIWTLVALSRRDVHDAFAQSERDVQRRPGWRWLAWTLAVVVVIGATTIVARTEGCGSKLDFAGISRILTLPQRLNLKVFGTVTDTATGKPIAGARAGDITEQILLKFDWRNLAAERRLLCGTVAEMDGRVVLKIENTNNTPLQLTLLKIADPMITAMRYVVTGEVKYNNVEGIGYLEMWNYFPPLQSGLSEERYFTRTLGNVGSDPMSQISGTSDWRMFSLPFSRTGTTKMPTRLEVNIFLPSRGVVFLGTIKLAQFVTANDPAKVPFDPAIDRAVRTISKCAEGDPRVEEAMQPLRKLAPAQVVAALVPYLDSATDTIRRSAIYILWKGGFADIGPAVAGLQKLLAHKEPATRGMAALALGQNRIASSYDALARMAKEDDSGYARRCAAYALGLLGDTRGIPVLQQAVTDRDPLVADNARFALDRLNSVASNAHASTAAAEAGLERRYTQEQMLDIQPNGSIRFKMILTTRNNSSEPLRADRFMNSDFVNLESMTDSRGRPIPFTAKHVGDTFQYELILPEPVPPGEWFSNTSEGTMRGLIKPTWRPGVYEYRMRHWPGAQQVTRRIETHRLPAGAQLLSKEPTDLIERSRDGRIELYIDREIPPGGSLEVIYRFRLPNETKP